MSSAASYDPTAPSTSTAGSSEQAVKTLQNRSETSKKQKRKRESEANTLSAVNEDYPSTSASPNKGKGRAVSFADNVAVQHEGSPPAAAAGVSQEDAFRASKAEADAERKAKSNKKTKAKARYLKNKMTRYKARKRADRQGKSEAGSSVGDRDTDMNDVTMDGDGNTTLGDTTVDKSAAVEAPEEKRARKKAKREERRAREALEAAAPTNEVTAEALSTLNAETSEPEAAERSGQVDEAAIRKAERKAKKEAKRAAAFAAERDGTEDVSMQHEDTNGDEQLLLKRDLAVLAKAEELKARQEKANKRAKAKQKYGKTETVDEDDKENEALPTQPDALPRFPKPVQPVAPSQRELDDLLISHDLRHAILVDRSTSVPITEVGKGGSQVELSQQTLDRLGEMKIEKFFAVQSAVVPVLMENKQLYTTRQRPRDICVSAPTGSGKTLSYVIPVVEALRARVVTRLRALVVLPTRELVMQVREVFEQFCKGTGLKVAAATGQHSFSNEQNAIVEEHEHNLQGGSSKIDILIVTPGRLMDHLKSTRNFTLQHLRFLVIDEADRLLSQNFNDWLKVLISNIENKEAKVDELASKEEAETTDVRSTFETDALAPQLMSSHYSTLETSETRSSASSTQKLLFSATLTRDPARIAALNLHRPVYIAVVDKTASTSGDGEETAATLLESDRNFALPETLIEKMIVTRTSDKALVLFYLLHTVKLRNTLCFTKSVESAARLVMLVEAFNAEYAKQAVAGSVEPLKVAHYSSELGPGQRKEAMESFKKGDIQILVCSDIAARGLDIPSIENVVNYDVPVDIRKYVHRVGRTARAGRSGTAWSLVETQEAKYFKTLLAEAGHLQKVRNVKVKRDDLEPYKDAFEVALTQLQV